MLALHADRLGSMETASDRNAMSPEGNHNKV